MSEHIDLVIADLTEKRDKLSDLIAKLEWFKVEFPRTAASLVMAPKKAKTDTVTRRVTDHADHGPQILAALKAHGGSMTPGALSNTLKVGLKTLRVWCEPLANANAILVTGKTAGRRISLPGKPPARGNL